MDHNPHTRIYTAEDIQNYLSGRLSPLQMNAMEKAALEDPFLAEAMEGYAITEDRHWEKQLAALKTSFAQKQQGAVIIPFTKKKNNWWKAAAAVFIIGGTAALAYFLLGDKKTSPEIAQQTVTNPVAATADSVVQAAPETKDVPASIAEAPSNTAKENKTIIRDITRSPREQEANKDFVYQPAQQPAAAAGAITESKAEAAIKSTVPAPAAPSTANSKPAEAVTSNNAAEGYSRNYADETDQLKKKAENNTVAGRSANKLNRTFHAQVMSTDNSPLPFANISNRAENFGTYADVKGNFSLLSNDSVLTVEIRSAGFKPQVVTLKSNVQQNRIILSEDVASLAETTVVGGNADMKNRVSRRAVLVKDSVLNVEPADGWDNYLTYATNNIDIPDDILKSNIHGQVELSFEVNSSGAITNIKVDKSLCDNCDEAAIRMLQKGPQWKIIKGKKGKGKIKVQF